MNIDGVNCLNNYYGMKINYNEEVNKIIISCIGTNSENILADTGLISPSFLVMIIFLNSLNGTSLIKIHSTSNNPGHLLS